MFQINISNHPYFTDMTRKAEMTELHFDKQKGTIIMGVKVSHFIGNKEITEYEKRIKLLLDNTAQYPTGNGDETIGDYDFFTMQAEGGAALKDLVENGILQVDSTGVLNSKCNYKDFVAEEPNV